MSCYPIVDDIINRCTGLTKGVEPTAWVVPFTGTSVVTDENEITTFVPNVAVQDVYAKITAARFGLNAGHSIVVSEVKENAFKHTFSAVINLTDAKVLDKMDGIIVIVKQNAGGYLVYGATRGLWKASQTRMTNDNSGMTTVTYESRADMEEGYSDYSFNLGTDQTDAFILNMLSTIGFAAEISTGNGFTVECDTPILILEANTKWIYGAMIGDTFTGTVYVFPITGQTYTFTSPQA